MLKYEAKDSEIEALGLSEQDPPAPNPYVESSVPVVQEDFNEDD